MLQCLATDKKLAVQVKTALQYRSGVSQTSAMLSNRCPTVSRRLAFVCSIASSFTSTASIFDTILPIECSIRSTLRCSIENSSWVTPRPPRLFPLHPLRPAPPCISDFVVVESSSSSLGSKLSESSFSANCKKIIRLTVASNT